MLTLALLPPINDWVYIVVYTIYAITILGTIVIIITENRNPVKSLAWVLVLAFLPIVGLVFYIFFRAEFQGEKNGFPTHKEEITKAGLSFDRQYRQSSTERGEQARDKIVPQFVQCTVLFGKPREDIHFGRRQIQTLPARFGDCPRVYPYPILHLRGR